MCHIRSAAGRSLNSDTAPLQVLYPEQKNQTLQILWCYEHCGQPRPESGLDCLTCAILDALDVEWLKHQKQFPAKAENRSVVVTEEGSYLRLIDSCITQLKAPGPSRTCNESKEDTRLSASTPCDRASSTPPSPVCRDCLGFTVQGLGFVLISDLDMNTIFWNWFTWATRHF